MADGNFRAYRRDPVAPRSADVPARGQIDDPLAELARLIGQSEPMNEIGGDAGRGSASSFDQSAGGIDWAAGDRYDEQSEPAEQNYDARYDQRSEPVTESYPSYRPSPSSQGSEYEAVPDQFSAPEPRFNTLRESARAYTTEQPRYRDQQEPTETFGRLPAFLPRREERYQYDDQAEDSDDQAYAPEDYEAEAPNGRRRGGFVVIAAVLALAVLGTAGAFAYRAMFGVSMLPSLPPIIKADDGPNKIVPSSSKSSMPAQADANASSGEKLVSREEQPVNMPAPVNPAPRVVSTIPIFPDPNSAQAGIVASGALNIPASVVPATAPPAATTPPPVTRAPALANAAPVPPLAAAPAAPPIASSEPKKIHTVAIRPDQMGRTDQAAPAPPPQAPVRAPPPRAAAAPAPRPTPAPQAAANAPLSIVPQQDGVAQTSAPAHTRTALAQPMPLDATAESAPAPRAGAGYAVQVTSQRSEAEAQAEFRALRAKFPNQLGGREPIVRRADLGAKGVFYRALVGPFASMEQAAGMCSNLKAAGGNCIVQRD